MHIKLANPRGFCAGVDRAIAIVERALAQLGPPLYVRHEVVHNLFVVERLKKSGVVFVDHIESVPFGAAVVYSAHGVSQMVRACALERRLHVFDATCPLVTKVHVEVARLSRREQEVVLIGHAGHPEVEGTLGQYNSSRGGIYLVETKADVFSLKVKNPENLAYVTQTTLSMDDTAVIIQCLRERFPSIQGPKKDDICYATENRQNAVKTLAQQCDLVLVVGSANSSNSNRLRELAERLGCRAYLVDNAKQIRRDWFWTDAVVGVTAGASAPEVLVQEIVEQLKVWGGVLVEELPGQKEEIVFALPRELREEQSSGF